MKLRRLLKDRRGDISSPIIVILVTVAALAVAGMAVAWMASTGGKASSQGSTIIIGTPVISGNQLLLTVKNVGNAAVTISNATVTVGSNVYYASSISPSSVNGGESKAVTVTLTGNPGLSTGQTCTGSLLTDQGTISFSAVGQ